MRSWILLAVATGPLAISAACASSEEQAAPGREQPPSTVLDAEAPDSAAAPEWDGDVPDTSLPRCSPSGWCVTAFPDEDLDFRDIWPFEDRAFAIVQSRTQGVRVLEWQKSTDAWQYIDDASQNAVGVETFAGRIYAPNEGEVYFTVSPSFVYHGKRPVAPETAWRWTRQALPDNVTGHRPDDDHGRPYNMATRDRQVTLGVWGVGPLDIYAYYSNTIFKREPLDGAWSAVYVADDVAADEHIYFTAVAGTGPDDIWFSGVRALYSYVCPLLVRKNADAWGRVADGVVKTTAPDSCDVRAGTVRVGEGFGGWLTELQAISPTEYIGLQDAMGPWEVDHVSLTKVRVGDSVYSVEQSTVPVGNASSSSPQVISSLWRVNADNWFTSWGLVLRGTEDGAFAVSSISRDGAPVAAPLHRIRGTSNQNLWAIGVRNAFHKTTL